MRNFVTITVVGDDFPFKDIKRETTAYDHAAHHGARMGTGAGKPLMVEHTLENPTPEDQTNMKTKMERWLIEITEAAKVVASVECPFNGRAPIVTIGR